MSDESVCNATGNFWRNVPDGKDKIVPDHCECLKDNETFVSGQGCVPLCTLDPQDCICKFDAKVVHPEYENTCNVKLGISGCKYESGACAPKYY